MMAARDDGLCTYKGPDRRLFKVWCAQGYAEQAEPLLVMQRSCLGGAVRLWQISWGLNLSIVLGFPFDLLPVEGKFPVRREVAYQPPFFSQPELLVHCLC